MSTFEVAYELKIERKMTDSDSDASLKSDIDDAELSLTSSSSIPTKSRKKYEFAYAQFEQWREERNVDIINEKLLLAFFKWKAKSNKATTLWTLYSMIRRMLWMQKRVEIGKFTHLLAFLKRKSQGHDIKKSKVFTQDELDKFLIEADDKTYLMIKVALIMGVSGSCRRDELTKLLTKDVTDEGSYIKISLSVTKKKYLREFMITPGNTENLNLVEIVQKYIKIRPSETESERFFLGYRNGSCIRQPVGINTIGTFPKSIAKFLQLPDADHYTGHSFRRTAITLLENAGISQHIIELPHHFVSNIRNSHLQVITKPDSKRVPSPTLAIRNRSGGASINHHLPATEIIPKIEVDDTDYCQIMSDNSSHNQTQLAEDNPLSEMSSASTTQAQKKMVSHGVTEEFKAFGVHMAVQLSQLPLYDALVLQDEMQALITNHRLRKLKKASSSTT